MDGARVVALVAVCVAGTASVRVVMNTLVRLVESRRGVQRGLSDEALVQRLDRIELALDAIAIEVERSGELQRFTAQLRTPMPSGPRASVGDPALHGRVITPH